MTNQTYAFTLNQKLLKQFSNFNRLGYYCYHATTLDIQGTTMKIENYQTDAQLQQQVFQLLSQELGVSNFIRFIQHYEQGSGDYTRDRESWQSGYTVDSLANAIAEWKQQKFS